MKFLRNCLILSEFAIFSWQNSRKKGHFFQFFKPFLRNRVFCPEMTQYGENVLFLNEIAPSFSKNRNFRVLKCKRIGNFVIFAKLSASLPTKNDFAHSTTTFARTDSLRKLIQLFAQKTVVFQVFLATPKINFNFTLSFHIFVS